MNTIARLQLEMAAAGCVSGLLREWPLLRIVFMEHRFFLSIRAPARTLRLLSQVILEFEEEMQ